MLLAKTPSPWRSSLKGNVSPISGRQAPRCHAAAPVRGSMSIMSRLRISVAAFCAAIIANLLVFAPGARGAGGGDPVRGERLYGRCVACHSLERNRTGPEHCGLIGRRAGRVPGFNYSKALRDSGIIWNRETLDVFLEDPLRTVPGTKMGYAGVKNPQDRADLIAFLESATPAADECR